MKKPEVVLVTVTQTRTVPVLATSSKAARNHANACSEDPSFWTKPTRVEIRAVKITKLTQITRSVRDGEMLTDLSAAPAILAANQKNPEGPTVVVAGDLHSAWTGLGLAPKPKKRIAARAKKNAKASKKRGRPAKKASALSRGARKKKAARRSKNKAA